MASPTTSSARPRSVTTPVDANNYDTASLVESSSASSAVPRRRESVGTHAESLEIVVTMPDHDSKTVVALDDLEDPNAKAKRKLGAALSPRSDAMAPKSDAMTSKTSYVPATTVAFWLGMWFVQNIGVTFWNKKALSAIRLPVTLTFVHMVCNTLGAALYIYAYKGVDRKPLKPGQRSLMVYFSLIFVSNIITGNMSLGLVSITFNQIMRALVPGVVVVLSMLILGKSYSTTRKASLLPVAYGVYLTCTGDNSCTFIGLLITVVAVIFAGLKAVLSSKFLSGDLKLHPVDLILHQAPLSAMWCLLAMVMTGEWQTLMRNWSDLPALSVWYLVTGVISFLLNVTSFQANKVTSPVTLCVCGNVKQIMVITMSIMINHDVITTQKIVGISLVTMGGVAYAYISNREMNKATVPVRPAIPV